MSGSSAAPEIGLFLNIGEQMMGGSTAGWDDIKAMALLAEEVGFRSIWLPDHLLFRMEPGNPEGFRESMSILSALAAVTSTVELGAAVNCTSFRNPALFAKMVETIDEISGGRMVVGLGAGYHDPEYLAFGYPIDYRYSRFVEAFDIITGLLRSGSVNLDGTFYSANHCLLTPRGPRPQGPRIMVGTTGYKMLELTAQHADEWNGWLATHGNNPADVVPMRELVDAACERVGRDPATLERSVGLLASATGVKKAHVSRLGPVLTGSNDELVEVFHQFGEEGIDRIQLWAYPNTMAGIEAFGGVLTELN